MFHLTEDQYFDKYKMPDIDSAMLDGTLNEIFEKNNYNLDVISQNPKFQSSKDYTNWKQHFIYETISDFTSRNVFAETKQKQLDMLVKHGVISSYSIDGHALQINIDGEKPIYVSALTEEFPELANIDPTLTAKNARAGHCRTKSLQVVSPFLSEPHHIVSGTIGGINRRSRYLHTWVEKNFNGVPCVIDTTLNAIVDRESYIKLTGAFTQCSISNKELAEDSPTITPLLSSNQLYIEQYLYNRHELMAYLQMING